MLEDYYSSTRTIWRFRNCGMCSPYLDDLSDYFADLKLSNITIRGYLRAVRHFSIFALHECKTDIGEMSEELVDSFIREHLSVCSCERMNSHIFSESVSAMRYAVDFFSSRNLIDFTTKKLPLVPFPIYRSTQEDNGSTTVDHVEDKPKKTKVQVSASSLTPRRPAEERYQKEIANLPIAGGELLLRYDEYLIRLFGLTEKTRKIHRNKTLFFIRWIYETNGFNFDFANLSTSEIVEFQEMCNSEGFSYDYRKTMMSCLRGFLRFLKWEGILKEDLTVAVYPLLKWKKSEVPRFIPYELAQSLLDSVERDSFLGSRDYLMLLLLVQLGVRACEVIGLQIGDFQLRKGTVLIRATKNHKERVLPITEEIADAVIDYLKWRQPLSEAKELFVSFRPPHIALASSSVVGGVAARYIEKSGIDAPFKGSHLLRHSLATHLVNCDVSFKSTSDILGHTDIDTTTIYAKVDMTHLREIALPLPATWRKVGV